MKKISKGQGLELIVKLEAAGLNRDLAHLIITAPNNEVSKMIIATVGAYLEKQPPVEVDWSNHFEKINEFKILIPNDPSLANFRDQYEDKFVKIDEDLTDENFLPSNYFIPGITKMASIYRITKKIKGLACVDFASKKGELPNAQGLSALWMQNEEVFSERLWYLGLDHSNSLFKKSANETLVSVIGHSVSGRVFDTVKLEEELSPGFCVVVFN